LACLYPTGGRYRFSVVEDVEAAMSRGDRARCQSLATDPATPRDRCLGKGKIAAWGSSHSYVDPVSVCVSVLSVCKYYYIAMTNQLILSNWLRLLLWTLSHYITRFSKGLTGTVTLTGIDHAWC